MCAIYEEHKLTSDMQKMIPLTHTWHVFQFSPHTFARILIKFAITFWITGCFESCRVIRFILCEVLWERLLIVFKQRLLQWKVFCNTVNYFSRGLERSVLRTDFLTFLLTLVVRIRYYIKAVDVVFFLLNNTMILNLLMKGLKLPLLQ